ncbi:MAG: enoyl-CoA hydratase-related protein [Spirochaetota bacterium]
MNSPALLTNVHKQENGAIFEIIMNRPEVHNAVNGEMAKLFLAAWTEFKENSDLTVAVLRGAGNKSFCSGADLNALEELVNLNATPEEEKKYIQEAKGPMGGTRIVQTKPVITVSQGYTYAGGLELFCHGHIRIAEKQAMFSVSCRRWGVPLIDGGTVFLPRLLGMANALPLIITGQRIRAKRAYEIGLIWELVEKGKGVERAMKLAKQICAQPHDALFADMNSVLNGYHMPLEEALKYEAKNVFPVCRSKSFQEGVKSFQEGNRFWVR